MGEVLTSDPSLGLSLGGGEEGGAWFLLLKGTIWGHISSSYPLKGQGCHLGRGPRNFPEAASNGTGVWKETQEGGWGAQHRHNPDT